MTDKKKSYICEYCPRTYPNKCLLATHVRTHTGEKPFVCEVCRRAFAHKGDLTRHTRMHTGERPFKCPHCTRAFAHNSNLKQHLTCHSNIRLFKCDVCDKSFTRKSMLKQHLRLHNPPFFECYQCQQTFPHKRGLLQHIRCHIDNWKFKCEFCDKGFSNKTHLANHIRTHSGEKPFSCKYCNRPFSDKSNLGRHEMIHFNKTLHVSQGEGDTSCVLPKAKQQTKAKSHSGTTTHKCEHCQREFTLKSNLVIHIRSHTGEKPYSCDKCLKLFSHKSNMTRHMKLHLENEVDKYVTSDQVPDKTSNCLRQTIGTRKGVEDRLSGEFISSDEDNRTLDHTHIYSQSKIPQKNHLLFQQRANFSTARHNMSSLEQPMSLNYLEKNNKILETTVAQNIQPVHTQYLNKEVSTRTNQNMNSIESSIPNTFPHSPEHLRNLDVDMRRYLVHKNPHKSYSSEPQVGNIGSLQKTQLPETQSCANTMISESFTPVSQACTNTVLHNSQPSTNITIHETYSTENPPYSNIIPCENSHTVAKNLAASDIHTNAFPYNLSNNLKFVGKDSGCPPLIKLNANRDWDSNLIAEQTIHIKDDIRALLQKTNALELNETHAHGTNSEDNLDSVDISRSKKDCSSHVYSHQNTPVSKSTHLDKRHTAAQTKLSSKSEVTMNLPRLIPIAMADDIEEPHTNNNAYIHPHQIQFPNYGECSLGSSSKFLTDQLCPRVQYPNNVIDERCIHSIVNNALRTNSHVINNHGGQEQNSDKRNFIANEVYNMFHEAYVPRHQIQNVPFQTESIEPALRHINSYNFTPRQHKKGITTLLSWLPNA